MTRIFETGVLSTNQFDDFDDMAVTAASAWGQRYRKLEGVEENGFAHQLNLPTAQMTHIGWQPGMRIESGTPEDAIGFVLQTSKHGRMRANGKVVEADEILVMHAPRDYELVNPAGTSYLVLSIEKERVYRHLEGLWGELPRSLDKTSRLLCAEKYQWQQIAGAFHNHLNLAYFDPACLLNLAEREAMVDELLDTMLLSSEAAAPDRRQAMRHVLAERAVQYLRDNVDDIVTLQSMCRHVGVSERSLRQGFRERFGQSPKAYIKQHRLHQLRQLLRIAVHGEITVTQAALRTGLTHLGRLGHEYRALFGESPSETLVRPAPGVPSSGAI